VRILLDAGVARIVGAELDGQIVSAGLFTLFNGLVYHTLSGHSTVGTEAQAPTLLLWETIKRYRGEGAKRFNFGGCSASAIEEGSPEHGVYVYKNAFGGECIECTSGRKVLRTVRYGLARGLKAALGRR
jgi:lipid II:glycine glycyltransferase (peptidoglycan interpeptide bridge formation enzyme)